MSDEKEKISMNSPGEMAADQEGTVKSGKQTSEAPGESQRFLNAIIETAPT